MKGIPGRPATALRALRRNARRVVLEGALAARRLGAERPPPDFVIAGAQRCGTTSLFRALARHPAMMSNVIDAKGVHYFDTAYDRGRRWYLAHFPDRSARRRRTAETGHDAVAGEASPYYLFHPAGAERMAETIPDAKIVVLLRDPVKRAISHHLHMVWEGHEPVGDLDAALDLEPARLAGLEERLAADPSFVSRPHQHFSYVARGHYAVQLERLYARFPRENVLVMATETLTRDSERSLAAVQSFVGLEPDPSITLEKRNASLRFEPRPETLARLTDAFAESNERLRGLVDCEIPWLRDRPAGARPPEA